MAKVLSNEDLAAAEKRGAKITKHPQMMEMPGLIDTVKALGEAQLAASKHQSQQLIKAVEALTRSINSKKFEGTDVSELVAAVAGLKTEAVAVHQPLDYRMTWNRDKRHLIDGEQGILVTAVPQRLDS